MLQKLWSLARSTGAAALVGTALAGGLALGGCRPQAGGGAAVAPAGARETLITEEQIARMSVRTAWEVVRLRSPRFASGINPSTGRPTGVRIEEQRSVNADMTPLLIVDGVQMFDLSYLEQIAAAEVHAIHIIGSDVAQPLYGLRAAGGAIVVETKRGR